MILKIAWRNLWRNKRRTMIIITSIIIGVAALVVYDSLARGMVTQMLNNSIKSNASHIQIHHKNFSNERVIKNYIEDPGYIEKVLEKKDFIKNFSKRVVVTGLISSATSSSGITLMGVQPDKESMITDIKSSVIKGKYLNGKSNEIVIGAKIADKLEVEKGDKVVVYSAGLDGSVSTQLFRVAGIFKTGSSEFDGMYVYINLETAQEMLGLGNKVHEFAMITENKNKTLEYRDELRSELDHGKEYEVLAYQDLLPLVVSYVEVFEQSNFIVYLIIITGILFGVVNSMLMPVFERIHEFGVLMSIGMKTRKIFYMVMQEALILGTFGAIIGTGVGLLALWPMFNTGVDLSVFSESLANMGIGSVIYPKLAVNIFINALLLMPVATVIGAIYPARKAIKLHPTEALRYV